MWRDAVETVRRFSWTNPWGDPVAPVIPFPDLEQRREFLRNLEESKGNGWVLVVAASGFLTDSYNLFASNVILPALSYVYWSDSGSSSSYDIYFNLTTLIASAVGQVVFGVLADIYGRRALYGLELIIVIISTIGLVQCSRGYMEDGNWTWNVTGWLLAWRTIMGFGIGAEYPLSACIAAEWSSAKARAPIMSTVFLMQPVGQLAAYGAGFTIINYVKHRTSKIGVDVFWRFVVAMGCIPTIFALVFRLSIPESGRFTFDVLKNEHQATTDTSKVYSRGRDPRNSIQKTGTPPRGDQFRLEELRAYLITDGNWLYLFGASACWFLLDFAFFGLGFNNPGMLAKLWTRHDLDFPPCSPWWLNSSSIDPYKYANITTSLCSDPAQVDGLIDGVLYRNMKSGVLIVSIASIVGSMLMVALVNRIERKQMLMWTFSILAVLLFAMAGSFRTLFHQEQHGVLIMFWVLISFFFNFGPNTLTFIFPAEIFPTRYRCTFYGIAAASGKLGAVAVQLVLLAHKSLRSADSSDIWGLILAFGFCMVLGALISAFCLPVVQYRSADDPYKLKNRTLEELADGRRRRHKQENAAVLELDEVHHEPVRPMEENQGWREEFGFDPGRRSISESESARGGSEDDVRGSSSTL